MEKSVKHFVGKILGVHLLLLALLLAMVGCAASYIYQSARAQAMRQAQERQTLLAAETAHGIDGFYESILSDLNLVKPDEDDDSDLPDQPQQSTEARPFAGLPNVRQAISLLLTRQLQGRAYLFMVDEQMRPHALGADDHPLKPGQMAPRSLIVANPASAPALGFEQELIARFGPWLKQSEKPAISPLELIEQRSIKLVSVPLMVPQRVGGPRSSTVQRRAGWLVAAVSARPIEQHFLQDLTHHDLSMALLVDETMTVMAASPRHEWVGTRISAQTAPELNEVLDELHHVKYTGTRSISAPFRLGDQQFDSALVTAYPVEVMDKPWFVLVASPISQVGSAMREFSQKALLGALFVALAMTAILVSTAAQLIFTRMRMERVRHQMLRKEMHQARQIQLAWLPQKTKTLCGAARVEIASLNRPATHISGDFYNFWELPDGRTAVVIGDVTGHGTAAAFLMATTQLLIRNTLPQYCDPGRCLEDVNRQLTNQVFNGQFVTMQVLVIDPRSGEVAIATAGHPAPLASDGENFQSIKIEPQLVAGVDSSTRYPTERFMMRPDTSLLLYTDGVVETENPAGDRLRLDGLRRALAGGVGSAEGLLQKAVSAVNTFRRGRDLIDDLTLVAIHLLPHPQATESPEQLEVGPKATAAGKYAVHS